MVSSTELMKQAEHCGRGSTPTLNQTGELKEAFWLTSRWVSSLAKISASFGEAKYPASALAGDGVHDPADELLDAGIPARRIREAVEILGGDDVGRGQGPVGRNLHPLLFEDHFPCWLVMRASRRSHDSSSNGCTCSREKKRRNVNPRPRGAWCGGSDGCLLRCLFFDIHNRSAPLCESPYDVAGQPLHHGQAQPRSASDHTQSGACRGVTRGSRYTPGKLSLSIAKIPYFVPGEETLHNILWIRHLTPCSAGTFSFSRVCTIIRSPARVRGARVRDRPELSSARRGASCLD